MRLGMHIFELAKRAGLRHYVYSTLEYASKVRPSGLPTISEAHSLTF